MSTINTKNQLGTIVLAAGGSKRMGEPKQLLRFRNDNLIRQSVYTALIACPGPVAAVVGSNASLVAEEILGLPVLIVNNERWQEGIGSSIRIGVKQLLETYPELTAIMITLCDQPMINEDYLTKLISIFEKEENPAIATSYGSQPGVPAIFSKKYFPDLLALSGDSGAKEILLREPDSVFLVHFQQVIKDIDTPEDYERLRRYAMEQT